MQSNDNLKSCIVESQDKNVNQDVAILKDFKKSQIAVDETKTQQIYYQLLSTHGPEDYEVLSKLV